MCFGDRVNLRTARTTLRPWRADEADRLHDILRRPEVTGWLGDPRPASRAQIDEVIARHRDEDGIPVGLAIVPTGAATPAGTVMVDRLSNGDPQLGWYLHPDAQGHGWATEAAAAMLAFAVESGAPRIWAGMWPHNRGSAGICRRIGMVDLGRQDDPWYGTVEYPLSRQFCLWQPGAEHPLDVLARLNATVTRRHATEEPPVGPDGWTYPGPP